MPAIRRLHLALLLVLACGPDKDPTLDDGTSPADTEPDATDPSSPTTPTTGAIDDNPAGACSPFAGTACPAAYICCSDDPATVGGRTPDYFMPGVLDEDHATPIFSGANNDLSHTGQCVDVGGFPSPFATGCPVPCNPRWQPDRLLEICGTTSVCCSFTDLDPDKDCVLDPDTGMWRAATGADIPELTTWGGLHTTNQDPDGESCQMFASAGGPLDADAFEDCIAQLGVADQRGFCYSPSECPCREDLCDQKNPGWIPRCP